MPNEPQSSIFLPLRTSVDLFSDPTQPSALTRAKQAAALHDRVFIEVGFYDVSLTDQGGIQWWTPPQQITPEQIARARNPPEAGKPMSFGFGVQAAKGAPAEEMTTAVSGSITMAYAAEWHSEVIEPLVALGADFIEPIATGGDDPFDTRSEMGEAFRRQNSHDWLDKSLMPDTNTFRRDFIRKSFTRDAVIAQDLGAVLQVSTLFEPMLERHGFQATGTTAVQIAAPNLDALEWEQVLEFRGHPGALEARQMLREWEQAAADQEPGDANEFLMKVSQETMQGMLAALHEQQPKLGRTVVEEAAKTAVGFVPIVGAFIGGAVSVGETAAERLRESRSGIAALMKLQS